MKILSQLIDYLQMQWDLNPKPFIGVCIVIVIAVCWLGSIYEREKHGIS